LLSGGFRIKPQAVATTRWVQGASIGELNGKKFVVQGQIDNQLDVTTEIGILEQRCSSLGDFWLIVTVQEIK
jgi:hypothetical protein